MIRVIRVIRGFFNLLPRERLPFLPTRERLRLCLLFSILECYFAAGCDLPVGLGSQVADPLG